MNIRLLFSRFHPQAARFAADSRFPGRLHSRPWRGRGCPLPHRPTRRGVGIHGHSGRRVNRPGLGCRRPEGLGWLFDNPRLRASGRGGERWRARSTPVACRRSGAPAGQCECDSLRVGALSRDFRQQGGKQIPQRPGMVGHRRGPGQDRRNHGGQGRAVERRDSLSGGVQGGAESPHVRGGIGAAAFQLFRGHVLRRADHLARAGQLRGRVDDPGDAEISDDSALPGQEHIVRFQVTMHDPGSMRVRQRVRDLRADLRHSLPRHTPGRRDLRAQRPAGDELHHDPRCAVMLYYVMDGDYPGMVQPRRGPRLPHRAGNQFTALGRRQLPRQQHLLDRHLTVEHLVVTAPYPPHAALADRLGQQVSPANQNPRPTWHTRMVVETTHQGLTVTLKTPQRSPRLTAKP